MQPAHASWKGAFGVLGMHQKLPLLLLQVTVLEAAAGPAQGATGKSWAWLNSNYKTPQHYRGMHPVGVWHA